MDFFKQKAFTPITQLLTAWQKGDQYALGQLTPLVYRELQNLANRYMHKERSGHTLQATALVHEAYVRANNAKVTLHDRHHFFFLMAKLMRQVLVDHSRSKARSKRQSDNAHVNQDADESQLSSTIDPIDIDVALSELAAQSPRLAHVTELHYFAGLTCPEIATITSLSESSIHRDLRLAKAWLLSHLSK